MVKSCSAPNCSERFTKKGETNSAYTFHRFPKEENKREKWEISLRKTETNFKAKSSSVLCSKHFPEECFYTTYKGKRYLKVDAIPTLFDFPKPLKLPQEFGDSKTLSEMVQTCCVKGCKRDKGGAVTFHKFPKDEVHRKLWVAQLKRENFIVKDSTKLCSKHFKEECFDRSKFGGTWLKKDAIPTIFNLCNCPKKQTPVKEFIPQVEGETILPSLNIPSFQNQVEGETILPSLNIQSFQNQVEGETILPSLNIPSFQNQVTVDTVAPSSNVWNVQNQVKVETILPSLNIPSFQNQAVKVEEVSLSESESSPFEEKTIVAPVSQNQGDAVEKEKRKYYLGDYDENDMHSPSKAKRVLALAKARDEASKKEIKRLRNKNMKMARKIKSLKEILNDLMSKKLKEVRKISKKDRDRTSRCIDDMVEEIGMIINNQSPTTSDCEADSVRLCPNKKPQRSTASSGCSSSVPQNKHKALEEEIQTEGGQSQWQPVGYSNGGQKLYIKNTIEMGEKITD